MTWQCIIPLSLYLLYLYGIYLIRLGQWSVDLKASTSLNAPDKRSPACKEASGQFGRFKTLIFQLLDRCSNNFVTVAHLILISFFFSFRRSKFWGSPWKAEWSHHHFLVFESWNPGNINESGMENEVMPIQLAKLELVKTYPSQALISLTLNSYRLEASGRRLKATS